MSTGALVSMMKDSKGFVWFAMTGGINRYDGNEFKIFRTNPEDSTTISSGGPAAIAEDKNGIIWIDCTIPQGLNAYNPATGKFTRYSEIPYYKHKLPDNRILNMLVDSNNLLWMCAEGEGVYSWDRKTNMIKHFTHNPDDSSSLANNNVWSCALTYDGNIYFCMPGDVDLFDVKKNKFTHYSIHTTDPSPPFGIWNIGVFCDSKKHVWISTDEGLSIFDSSMKQIIAYPQDVTGAMSTDMGKQLKETPDGKLWINTDHGLYVYDPSTKNISTYKHDDKDINSISAYMDGGLLYDQSGVMWIQGGYPVNKVDVSPEQFHTTLMDDKDKLLPGSFRCVYQNPSGQIFVGGPLGIFTFDYDTKKFLPFTPDASAKKMLSTHKLQNIYQDKNGVYWFGVDFTELISYDPKTKNWSAWQYNKAHDPDSLGVQNIHATLQNDDGKIWFGGTSSLCTYNSLTKKFKSYLIDPRNQRTSVNSIYVIIKPGDGKLWFGSLGLSYYDVKKDSVIHVAFKQNTAARILSNSRISSALQDDSARVWFGTEGNGMFLYDFRTGQCKRISTADGLPNDRIFGISKDLHGILWIGTDGGLCKYNPSRNLFDAKNKGDFRTYTASYTFPLRAFSGSDGTLYFRAYALAGLLYFHPDSLKDNAFIPPVLITDFKLFNKSVSAGDSTHVLDSTIETTREITLSYKQNIFSFTFAALSFVHPENNKYAYKLAGFDKDWTYTDASHRFASYTNLDAGDYTFEVKGSNNDGVWNESPAIIHLIITPPFWETWWFRTLIILAALGLTYGIYRYRLQEVIRLQNIRNKISGDLHDDIGSTLNSISVYSEVAKQDPSKHAKALEMIGEASRKIIDAMSDIVWTINPENDSFENIIERMRSLSFNLLRAKNIEFSFRADESLNDQKLTMEQRRNFFLIFKEAVNNLVKYAEATRVTIQLTHEGSLIKLLIRDNGKGFDVNQHSEGNGLNSMRRRAKEMRAELRIESAIGNGTSVELKMKT